MTMAEENPGWRAGVLEENGAADDTVSVVDGISADVESPVTAQDRIIAEIEQEQFADAEAADDDVAAITASFHEEPGLNVAGVRYTTSIDLLCEQVTDVYLADDRRPKLRRTAPRIVADGLLGRINDQIAKQNALVKKGDLIGVKRAPLSRLGFTEVGRLMGALYSVVSIAPSKRNSDPDLNVIAAYDDDENSPHFGTYRSENGHLRTIARRFRPGVSLKEVDDVVAALADYAPRVVRGEDQDMIAVKNGIVDYNGGKPKFRPFSPEHVFLAKLEVNWNPDAENPVIPNPEGCIAGHEDPADCTDACTTWDVESWMSTLSDDPEVVELLWQIIGAVARPYVSWNKCAFFFSSRGNNGKGTLLGLMRNMLGDGNHASIPLADFGKDFLLEPLTRANAVLVDENDVGTFVERAANFKAVVTNDVITMNRKYKTPIAHQHFGFMVQCINDQPQFKDKSESIYRRQLFVPFTKSFTGIERKYIKDVYLKRPDVLEYVLKRVLDGALTPAYYELSEPEAVLEALAEFKESNDPVRAFWEDIRDQLAWDLVPGTFIHDLYMAWMNRHMPKSSPIGRNKFLREMEALVVADADSEWTFVPSKDTPVRTATRMAAPERLIAEYGLTAWANPKVTLVDSDQSRDRYSTVPVHVLKTSYRGLVRRPAATSGAAPAAMRLADPELAAAVDRASKTASTPAAPVAPKTAPVTPAPRSAPKSTPTVPGGIVVPPDEPESECTGACANPYCESPAHRTGGGAA